MKTKIKIKIGVAAALLVASCVAAAAGQSSVVDAETAIANFKNTGDPCGQSDQVFVKFQDTFFAKTCRSLGGKPERVNESGLGCKTPDGGGMMLDVIPMPVAEPENVIGLNIQMQMKPTDQFTIESAFLMMVAIKSPGGGILECME